MDISWRNDADAEARSQWAVALEEQCAFINGLSAPQNSTESDRNTMSVAAEPMWDVLFTPESLGRSIILDRNSRIDATKLEAAARIMSAEKTLLDLLQDQALDSILPLTVAQFVSDIDSKEKVPKGKEFTVEQMSTILGAVKSKVNRETESAAEACNIYGGVTNAALRHFPAWVDDVWNEALTSVGEVTAADLEMITENLLPPQFDETAWVQDLTSHNERLDKARAVVLKAQSCQGLFGDILNDLEDGA